MARKQFPVDGKGRQDEWKAIEILKQKVIEQDIKKQKEQEKAKKQAYQYCINAIFHRAELETFMKLKEASKKQEHNFEQQHDQSIIRATHLGSVAVLFPELLPYIDLL